MTTNTATPTPTPMDPKYVPMCDPDTFEVTPRKREDVDTGDLYDRFMTIEGFLRWYRRYFVTTGDFVQQSFQIQSRQEIAYAAFMAGRDYEGLSTYDEYVKLVELFNAALQKDRTRGVEHRRIVLRNKNDRPGASSPTTAIAALPVLTPGNTTLDDIVGAVNATNQLVVALMAATQQPQSRRPGRIRRGLKYAFTPQGQHR